MASFIARSFGHQRSWHSSCSCQVRELESNPVLADSREGSWFAGPHHRGSRFADARPRPTRIAAPTSTRSGVDTSTLPPVISLIQDDGRFRFSGTVHRLPPCISSVILERTCPTNLPPSRGMPARDWHSSSPRPGTDRSKAPFMTPRPTRTSVSTGSRDSDGAVRSARGSRQAAIADQQEVRRCCHGRSSMCVGRRTCVWADPGEVSLIADGRGFRAVPPVKDGHGSCDRWCAAAFSVADRESENDCCRHRITCADWPHEALPSLSRRPSPLVRHHSHLCGMRQAIPLARGIV
jgi:hypothetical protein